MTTVLIVDDDEKLRTAMLRTLVARGYDARGASDVTEAVDILAKHPIEVLVTDLRMSGQDGIDLISRLRHVSPDTRPILMSAYATAKDHQTATDYGAVAVLCKPFEPEALLSAIDQAVDCETGYRGSIHGLSLVDLLQMFHFGRRSVTVTLPGLTTGKIHLDKGEIVNAEYGSLTGVEALRRLLSQASGSLRTGVLELTARTISGSFDGVLLDALRVLDEEGGSPNTDVLDFTSWSEPPRPPTPERESARLDEVRQQLEDVVTPLMPSATLIVVHGQPLDPDVLSPDSDEPGATLRDLARTVDRLTPFWTCIEQISDTTGLALLRLDEPDCLALILTPLLHRHGKERFRSQLRALADRVGGAPAPVSAERPARLIGGVRR